MAVVLVVDDEKEIAQLLDVCLKSEGFELSSVIRLSRLNRQLSRKRLILRYWMSCCRMEMAFHFAGRYAKDIIIPL